MTRREYQASLDDLRADVREMGALVLDRVDDGLTALEEGDEALAEALIEGDEEVNRRYLELESECIELFALQQPVASDLRFVAASFKILTDLERVGDLATNFGRYAIGADRRPRSEVEIAEIGDHAVALLEDALDAYARADAEACYDIAERDDEIDALCQTASNRVVRGVIEREGADDLWGVEQVLDDVSRALLTIRDLERVADHGVNVAARTLYMVESDPALIY